MNAWTTRAEASRNAIASNLRRILCDKNLTLVGAAELLGMDERTLRSLLHGKSCAQSKTLHRLAEGLGVSVSELLADDPAYAFDRATNPIVAEVVDSHRKLFRGWKPAEYEELCSRFGVGGALTEDGVLHFAKLMNERREIIRKVLAIFETSQRTALINIIEGLHKSMEVRPLAIEARNHVSRHS